MKIEGNASRFWVTLFVVVGASLLAFLVAAQPPGRGQPNYDRSTETEWRGTIAEVEYHESPPGFLGVHLLVKNDEGEIEVHVGPSSFLEQKAVSFKAGDEVVVTGSKVSYRGAPALLARRIVLGDTTLDLRDERGRPLWAGPN